MENFAPDAKKTMYLARLAALRSACSSVDLAHILQALLEDEQDIRDLLAPAKKSLSASLKLLGRDRISGTLDSYTSEMHKLVDLNIKLSPDVSELCVRAVGLAKRWKHEDVSNVHLLHSLIGMECAELSDILLDFGLCPYELMAQCLVILKRMPPAHVGPAHMSAVKDVLGGSTSWSPTADRHNFAEKQQPPESFTQNFLQQPPADSNESFAQPSDWMSETVLDTISSAMDQATLRGTSIHPDHLLAALLREPTGMVRQSLEQCLDLWRLEIELISNIEYKTFPVDNLILFSRETMSIVTKARAIAAQNGRKRIDTGDLFFSLLNSAIKQECDCALKGADNLIQDIRGRYLSLTSEPTSHDTTTADVVERLSCAIAVPVSHLVLHLLNMAKDEAKLDIASETNIIHLLKAWLMSTAIAEQSLSLMRTSVLEELDKLSHEASKNLTGQSAGSGITPSVIATRADFDPKFSDEVKETLSLAFDEARAIGEQLIQPNHILLSMLSQNIKVIDNLLKSRGSKKEVLRRRLKWCSQWHKEAWQRTFSGSAPVLNLEISDIDVIVERERWPRFDQAPEHIRALSSVSKDLLADALKFSTRCGCSEIGVEHVAVALTKNVSGTIANEVLFDLNASGCWPSGMSVDSTLLPRGGKRARNQKLSAKANQLLKEAWWHAQRFGSKQVQPEHILLAIATECDGIAFVACQILDIDGSTLYDVLMHRLQAKSA